MNRTKKVIIVMIMMMAILLPQFAVQDSAISVFASGEEWIEITSADELSSMKSGGSYYLTEDITATSKITISSSNEITLDLNGHSITAGTNENVGETTDRIFVVTGTFNLCDSVGTGTIGGTEEIMHDNGGVYVNNGGTFNMYGGTIAYNTAVSNGGGVYVNSGTFNMYGGVIENNVASSNGGGVYIASGSTFNYYNGDIKTNEKNGSLNNVSGYSSTTVQAQFHSGVVFEPISQSNFSSITSGGNYYLTDDVALTTSTYTISNSVVLDLNGKSITSTAAGRIFIVTDHLNIHDSVGGGTIGGTSETAHENGAIYVDGGVFKLYGGTIAYNQAETKGGAVYVTNRGLFEMFGGTIENNSAPTAGGAVYIDNDSSFIINGGTISGNSAKYGGGVYVDTYGIFIAAGGEISSNTATENGGGVYNCHDIEVSGDIVISENTVLGNANNLYSESDDIISVWGKLSSDAVIGITIDIDLESTANVGVVENFSRVDTASIASVFVSDQEDCQLYIQDSTILMTNDSSMHIYQYTVFEGVNNSTISKIGTSGNYYLTENINLSSQITIYNGAEVALDLNGYSITAGTNENDGETTDRIFVVNGNLSVYDSVGTGIIGGTADVMHDNGGVYINNGGTFSLYGGTIAYNKAETNGGAIYINDGSAYIYGGTIANNEAPGNGGAIYVNEDESLYMYGGEISNNSAQYGGGVFIKQDALFGMYGGTISANTASVQGGGIYNMHNFEVSGTVVVSGNKVDGDANNVYNDADDEIAVVGTLEDAIIGIANTSEDTRSNKHEAVVIGTEEYEYLSGVSLSCEYEIQAEDAKYFISDKDEILVYQKDNYWCFALGVNSSNVVDGTDTTHESVSMGNSAYVAQVNGGSVTLKVEEVESTEDSDAIIEYNEASETGTVSTVEFLNMELSVASGDGSEVLSDAGVVVEIVVAYDFSSKTDITVFRNHDGIVSAFEALESRPDAPYTDATFYADEENSLLYIYTQYFSTYAIGYNTLSISSSSSKIVLDSKYTVAGLLLAETEVEEEVQEETTTPSILPTETVTPVVPVVPEVPTTTSSSSNTVWWIILAVIAVGVVGYVVYKKKKSA